MLSEKAHNQTRSDSFMPFTPISRAVLQRKCDCGTHTMGGGQCAECQKKNMSVGGRPLQTKLAISEPSDAYEQEADRVAEQVMRMSPADVNGQQNGKMARPRVQRRVNDSASGLAEAPPAVREVLNLPGQPLDPATRAFFEPRFGQDFSQVRLHSGAAAEQSAHQVGASAYTVGHNIVFGQGQFGAGTHMGGQLLPHELAHVVQQGAHGGVVQRRPSKSTTNYKFDTYRVTEKDLSDPDIVARFRSLPLRQLIQYRNQVTEPAVIVYLDQLLTDRLNAGTLDELFVNLKSEQDPAVRNYIDQWLTTHAPTSYEIALGTNKPGEAMTQMEASGISVKVLPDEFVDEATFKSSTDKVSSGEVTENTKSITFYDPKWHPRWIETRGRVSSVKPIIQELKIKTVYLRGTSRITRSGYGVGTRQVDVETGRISLAHHEGSHAICFIQYMKDNSPPTFTGRVGDTDTSVKNKEEVFNIAMEKYYAGMAALCGPTVDCAGKKAKFCP